MKKKFLILAGLLACWGLAEAQVVSDTNYKAYYAFSGTYDDGSGHNNNAEGKDVTFTTDRWGIGNSAVAFSATPGVVQGKSFETGGEFSVAAWIKCLNPKAFYARVIDFGDSFSSDNILLAFYQSSGRLTGEAYSGTTGGGTDKVIVTKDPIVANQWVHVVYVNNGSGMGRIYVNGQLVAQAPQQIINKKTRAFHYFGKSLWTQDAAYVGKMDDIYVANRMFSDKEIDSLYRIVPADLSFKLDDVQLPLGETFLLRPTISKTYSLVEFSTYKSLDPSVATVSEGGLIRSQRIGSTKIVMSTANGAIVDTADVQVFDATLNAFYPFNNSFDDESGNGNKAEGTNVSFTSDRFGLPNSAVEFPATSAVVQGKSYPTGGAFSAAAWIKCKNPKSSYARILDFGNGQSMDNVLFALYGTTGALTGETYQGTMGGGENKVNTTDTIRSNVWTHVAYVNDGAGMGYVYINGTLAASKSQYIISEQTRTYHYFGKSLWAVDGIFEGKMDDIYVSSKVFSAKNIDSLYRIAPKDLDLSVADREIAINNSAKIAVQYNAKYDLRDFLKYRSLDPSIASVNDTGLVIALKKGFARIVVSTANGAVSDTAIVRVPDATMYAYYPFNNASGRDESANGRDMQIINARAVKSRFGERDSALQFGTSSMVAKAAATSLIDNKISFTAWVRVNSFPSDAVHISSVVGSYSPSWLGLRLGDADYAAANRAQFVISATNGQWVRVSGTNDLNTNQYYFIVGTYDGATARLYVNNKLEASQAFDQNFEITAPMEIGSSNSDRPLDGTIDEVRIYPRAISEKEIDSLFKIMPRQTITKFDIVEKKLSIQKDSSKLVNLEIEPSFDISQFLAFSSSNPSAATIDASGTITAHGVGTSKVSSAFANGLLSDTVEVIVTDTITYLTKMSIKTKKTTLIDGRSIDFPITYEPSTASVKRAIITSSNENVVTYENGKLTAKGAGKALVIVQSVSNPELKDTCVLTVIGKLIAYYPFNTNAKNEAAGQTGYNGVVDKAQLTTGIDGKLATAYHFNGKDQAINVEGVLPRNNFTYTVWIKPDSAARKRNQFIISAWNGDRSDVTRISVYDSSFYAGFEDNGYQSLRSNRFVKNNVWYFVSFVKQADSTCFYINGRKLQTMNNLPLTISKINTKFCIGANPEYGYNEFFAGTIDELRIYSDALSASQIDSLFLASTDSLSIAHKLTVYLDSTRNLPIYTNPNLDWSQNARFQSANPDIATVDANGAIKGIALGKAKIYGWFNNLIDSCEVNVAKFEAVTSVTFSKKTYALNSGNKQQLQLSVMPKTASDTTIIFTSTDNAIVSVSATGLVTAKAAGTARIVAKSLTNPTITDTCEFTVTVGVLVTKISLNLQKLNLRVTKTMQLGVDVLPTTATSKMAIYSVVDNTIADVSETGLITAKAEGTTLIIAQSASNPDVKDSCELTVVLPTALDESVVLASLFAPNPASSEVNISTAEQVLWVELTSALGNQIARLSVQNNNQIDVSELSCGVYFAYIHTAKGVLIEKLIIQR